MIKYPSIENHYQNKFIDRFLNIYPELTTVTYVVTEKIDGANLQLIFKPYQKKFQIASRNKIISKNEKFYNVWDVIFKYHELLDYTQELSNLTGRDIYVYGELFGYGIQNRIDYGRDKQFKIFDVKIVENDKTIMMTQKEVFGFFSNYCVSQIAFMNNLNDALKFEVPKNMEGVVIKPYDRVYYSSVGDIFYIKKKSPEFEEKMKFKPNENKLPEFDENVLKLHHEFGQYVNENRVYTVFSKHGEIEETEQIGKYIKLVLADANEDFLKDGYSFDGLSGKEIKYILNHSKNIVGFLQQKL